MDSRTSKRLRAPLLGVLLSLGVALSPSAADDSTKLFCEQWLGWGAAERDQWTKGIDGSAIQETKRNPDLSHWTDREHGAFQGCLTASMGLFAQRLEAACRAGIESVAEIGALSGERVKACMTETLTGQSDPSWNPGSEIEARPFCPDWQQWGQDKRREFLDKAEKIGVGIVEKRGASAEQVASFRRCFQGSREDLHSRFKAACAGGITYKDAFNMTGTSTDACAAEAGLGD